MENYAYSYTGKEDITIIYGYLTLTLYGIWFFSKDKNCYGVPVSLRNTDSSGDAFYGISLDDENNKLKIYISLDYCDECNTIIWVDRNFTDSTVMLDISLKFITAYHSGTISVDFRNANFNESRNAEDNKDLEQYWFTNLPFFEVWKLRKEKICFDGIDLDAILKDKLRSDRYVLDPFSYERECDGDYNSRQYEYIYYVWCDHNAGSPSDILQYKPKEQSGDDNILNGLKISAVFIDRETSGDYEISDESDEDYREYYYCSVFTTLYVFAADRDHPGSQLNGNSFVSSDRKHEVDWDVNLTNISIDFRRWEIDCFVIESQCFNIEAKYHGRRILLKFVVDPNWFGGVPPEDAE